LRGREAREEKYSSFLIWAISSVLLCPWAFVGYNRDPWPAAPLSKWYSPLHETTIYLTLSWHSQSAKNRYWNFNERESGSDGSDEPRPKSEVRTGVNRSLLKIFWSLDHKYSWQRCILRLPPWGFWPWEIARMDHSCYSSSPLTLRGLLHVRTIWCCEFSQHISDEKLRTAFKLKHQRFYIRTRMWGRTSSSFENLSIFQRTWTSSEIAQNHWDSAMTWSRNRFGLYLRNFLPVVLKKNDEVFLDGSDNTNRNEGGNSGWQRRTSSPVSMYTHSHLVRTYATAWQNCQLQAHPAGQFWGDHRRGVVDPNMARQRSCCVELRIVGKRVVRRWWGKRELINMRCRKQSRTTRRVLSMIYG